MDGSNWLRTWATLTAGACTQLPRTPGAPLPESDVLATNGLRYVVARGDWRDGAVVEAIPSWLLPPTHRAFSVPPLEPLPPPAGPRFDLWPEGFSGMNPAYAEQWRAARRRRCWWLELDGADRRLFDRLQYTRPLVPALRRALRERFGPDATVVSVVLTGSFVWAEDAATSVDATVVFDAPSDERFKIEHVMNERLEGDQVLIVDGREIALADLLFVGLGCLEQPGTVSGAIGDWRHADGRPFPYDLSRKRILAAIHQTHAAGVPIYGLDCFAAVEQKPAALTSLAYYFIQEATVLLAFRDNVVKAARRLLEANLILDLLARQNGKTPDGQLSGRSLDSVRALVRHSIAAESLADVHGWWGRRPSSLLEKSVSRLFRHAPQLDETVMERCQRAARDREPAWEVLKHRLESSSFGHELQSLYRVIAVDPACETDRRNDPIALGEPPSLDMVLSFGIARRTSGASHTRIDSEAQFLTQLPTLERTSEFDGLIDGFLHGLPLPVWLGDPSLTAAA